MTKNRLRDMRKRSGLTQQELSEKAGLSQAQIARLESGQSELTIEQMRIFAAALDCEPWELLPLEMQPSINQKELELVRLLRALNNTSEKMDNTSKKSKAG